MGKNITNEIVFTCTFPPIFHSTRIRVHRGVISQSGIDTERTQRQMNDATSRKRKPEVTKIENLKISFITII